MGARISGAPSTRRNLWIQTEIYGSKQNKKRQREREREREREGGRGRSNDEGEMDRPILGAATCSYMFSISLNVFRHRIIVESDTCTSKRINLCGVYVPLYLYVRMYLRLL